jgi:hypothetical protein
VLIEKSQIAAAPLTYLIRKRWVDSIYSIMNFDERIAIVHGCCFSNKENVHFKAIDKLITEK